MESYAGILKTMEDAYIEAGGSPAEMVSDIGLRLRVLAGELYRAQCEAQWIRRQSFPGTAEGAQLELHGAQRGVTRRPAERAVGEITFVRYLPLSFDLLIPKGTLCASSGEEAVEYETTAEAVLAAGALSVAAPAQAVEPGQKGNAAEGYINTLVTPVEGIQYASNRSDFTGGRDKEAEEAYRARVMDAYKRPLVTGSAAYYEGIAREIEGITSAQAVADAETPGKVNIYLWGENAAPDEALLAKAQEVLEKKKALGATLSVQAAKARKINLLLRFQLPEGVTNDDVKPQVEPVMQEYLRARQVGDAVPAAELLRLALQAVPEAIRVELPASMQNYTAAVGEKPIPGGFSLGVLS